MNFELENFQRMDILFDFSFVLNYFNHPEKDNES